MSKELHITDLTLGHETTQGSGGKCLTKHEDARRTRSSCDYRWQAYQSASKDPSPYNWPKYRDLRGQNTGTLALMHVKYTNGVFHVETRLQGVPREGEWNVKAGNFYESSNKPYYHEAHHMVPQGSLSGAIGYQAYKHPGRIHTLRQGLLMASYNLHDPVNMKILPMDPLVADKLELPVHLEAFPHAPDEPGSDDCHADYTTYIMYRLNKVFKGGPDGKKHAEDDLASYGDLKTAIEALSMEMRGKIIEARRVDPGLSSIHKLGTQLLTTSGR